MPSALGHAAVAVAIGSAFPREAVPRRAWLVGCCCAIAPDLDVIAFAFGVPYDSTFGHRGFVHGLAFAALLGVAASLVVSRITRWPIRKAALTAYLVIVTASHGLLDTLTNGGLGIALLSPFSNYRFFAPFRPVAVSPLGVEAFFSRWGLHVIASELVWIGVPCAALALAAWLWRHRAGQETATAR